MPSGCLGLFVRILMESFAVRIVQRVLDRVFKANAR